MKNIIYEPPCSCSLISVSRNQEEGVGFTPTPWSFISIAICTCLVVACGLNEGEFQVKGLRRSILPQFRGKDAYDDSLQFKEKL